MTKHRRTDPACREYRYRGPRNPITRYLDRRARGKSCPVCMAPFTRGALKMWPNTGEVHVRGDAPDELF